MPIESIVVSALIVAVFLVFGAVLAYGERQTRHLKRASDRPASPEDDGNRWLEAA
jgi:hypothetical protein